MKSKEIALEVILVLCLFLFFFFLYLVGWMPQSQGLR